MSVEPVGRADGRAAYVSATTTTDDHAATCAGCAAGVCGHADALMTDEYRAIEAWRSADPAAADHFDRATWPTT